MEYGRAVRTGLNTQITIVPVSLVKGLELDASVVVEPAAILEEEVQGARALYVALTRATKRLALVHARPLPSILVDARDDVEHEEQRRDDRRDRGDLERAEG